VSPTCSIVDVEITLSILALNSGDSKVQAENEGFVKMGISAEVAHYSESGPLKLFCITDSVGR
jgi:hypothetical protein